MRRKIEDVSAGLDLIADHKKSQSESFLDFLDKLDSLGIEDDVGSARERSLRPYSGQELDTTEPWK